MNLKYTWPLQTGSLQLGTSHRKTWSTPLQVRVSQDEGYRLEGPDDKDHSILGSK